MSEPIEVVRKKVITFGGSMTIALTSQLRKIGVQEGDEVVVEVYPDRLVIRGSIR